MFKKNNIKSAKTIEQIIQKSSFNNFIKNIDTNIKQIILNTQINQFSLLTKQQRIDSNTFRHIISIKHQGNISKPSKSKFKDKIRTLPSTKAQSLSNSFTKQQKKQLNKKLKSETKYQYFCIDNQKLKTDNSNKNEEQRFSSQKKSIKTEPCNELYQNKLKLYKPDNKKFSNILFELDIPSPKSKSISLQLQKLKIIDDSKNQVSQHTPEYCSKKKYQKEKEIKLRSIKNKNKKLLIPQYIRPIIQLQKDKIFKKILHPEQIFKENQQQKQWTKFFSQQKPKRNTHFKHKQAKYKQPRLSPPLQQIPFEVQIDKLSIKQKKQKQFSKTSPQKFKQLTSLIRKKNTIKQTQIQKNICGWQMNQGPYQIPNF